MRRRLPSLNSLMAFEAAARHGGFTKAAKELGVAQPAITRHVANLEEWLGAEMFKRKGNSVELSSDGHTISELVTPTFDRLELGLRQFAARRENEIVIGASFGMMHMWLMPRLTTLRGAAKGAVINFFTSENYADFDDTNIDFSIQFGTGEWTDKEASLIFTETTHVIASPDFLAKHPEINENDLVGSLKPEWLLDHGDPYNYGWMTWQLWYAYHGRPIPDVPRARDIHNYPTVLDMVRCGEGLTLGYVGLDDRLVETGEVVRLGQPLSRPNYGYYLLAHSGKTQSKASRELRKLLAINQK